MFKRLLLLAVFGLSIIFVLNPTIALASPAVDPGVTSFTSSTLSSLIIFASLVAVFFLVKGGYQLVSSTGKPDALEQAKKTIRNALLGLVLVLGAGVISTLLSNTFQVSTGGNFTDLNVLSPVKPTTPSDGLTQVLIDAVSGFMQNIIESTAKPIVSGIVGFLTTTPSVVTNSVIMKFWLVMVGIVDSLFVLVIALLGFQIMSADTFGFDEIEFRQILPRVGLAFLGANTSLFVIDWVISVSNILVQAVLNSTGGISHAWVLDAFNFVSLQSGATPLITMIFLSLFLILAIVLLLLYISRLIVVSLGAVLSPFIFLLWAVPKFADFAETAAKAYVVTIFTVFVHVVLIQLTSAFLALPDQSGDDALISILVAIGLFFTLLKTPALMMQLVVQGAHSGVVKKIGGQIVNVVGSKPAQDTAKRYVAQPVQA